MHHILHLICVLLGLLVLDAPLLDLAGQFVNGKAGIDTARVFQQGLVNEPILLLMKRGIASNLQQTRDSFGRRSDSAAADDVVDFPHLPLSR